jgi:chitinase
MLKPRGLLFSAALSASKKVIEGAYDFPAILPHFDFLNVMSYDYHGWFPDHEFTGHNAPLYRREEEDQEGHPGKVFRHN